MFTILLHRLCYPLDIWTQTWMCTFCCTLLFCIMCLQSRFRLHLQTLIKKGVHMIRLTIKLIVALFKYILYCFLRAFQCLMDLAQIITWLAQIILKFSAPLVYFLLLPFYPFIGLFGSFGTKLKQNFNMRKVKIREELSSSLTQSLNGCEEKICQKSPWLLCLIVIAGLPYFLTFTIISSIVEGIKHVKE